MRRKFLSGRQFTAAAAAALLLATAGCVTTPDKMPNAALPLLKDVEPTILQTQAELGVHVKQKTVVSTGGLIGALITTAIVTAIESHQASNREEILKPLRNELIGFEVEEMVKKEVEGAFKDIKWMSKKSADITTENAINVIEEIKDRGKKAVALISPKYNLTENFQNVKFELLFELYPASGEMRAAVKQGDEDVKPFYIVHRIIELPVAEGQGISKKESAKLLAKDKGKLIKELLTQGVKRTTELLREDLLNPKLADDS